jgi:hypothetical protein
MRLQTILTKGLRQTASLWPDIRKAYGWVHRAAHILGNDQECTEAGVRRRLQGLLGAMVRHQTKVGPLAPAVTHFVTVTRSYWPGLFHCYRLPELPRTNNDLEQFFGAHRYHERRATGRKVASPALVLRGSVRLAAAAATRLRTVEGEELVPENLRAWQALRQQLERRRLRRVQRYRFRRNPQAYLDALEKDLLQLILPP